MITIIKDVDLFEEIKKYDYLIVGAGLFGSVFAHEATKRGKTCLVIDKRPNVAGNIYTEKKENINLEPYVWPDGTKTSESKISGNRCMPKILKMWMDTVSDEQILDLDDAELYEGLSMKSFLVCKYGGIITAYESGQEFDDGE